MIPSSTMAKTKVRVVSQGVCEGQIERIPVYTLAYHTTQIPNGHMAWTLGTLHEKTNR